jgi:predicted extracellular nuclease
VISALRNPDIIALQEVENINVLNDLAQSIQSTPGGVTYTTALVPSNDVGGIDNGYLYRADRLTGVVVDQLGFNERLTLDDSCLHDRPPLRMRAVFQGVPFSLFNVHNRSLSGADAATTDGARIRRKRFEQADSIYAMLRSEQLAFPGQPVAVVGDFNAFEYSDGFVDSIGIIRGIVRPALLLSPTRPGTDPPALTNLVDLLAPEQRYSFIFQNSAQSLDHALVNAAALNLLGSAVYLRNNTDAPAHVFTEGPASCTTPYAPVCSQRVSDHDAVLVRFGDVIWRHGFEAED